MNKIVLLIALTILGATSCARPSLSILTIGDSNGAAEHGWVNQLRFLLPGDSIYNRSISGNTIGFDNLGNPALNTLRNLNRYLEEVDTEAERIDYVVIMLGTNDSKAIFKDREEEVLTNLEALLTGIKSFNYQGGKVPKIMVLSPPPYGPDEMVAEKYQGGSKRVKELAERYPAICQASGCHFIDIHQLLEPTFLQYSKDGVHLNAEGQMIIAREVAERLR